AAEGLGDVALDRHHLSEAHSYYADYLTAIERAYAGGSGYNTNSQGRTQGNARLQREVAIAHQRLADVSLRMGRSHEAMEEYQRCRRIAAGASTAFEPRNPEPRDVLGYCAARMSGASTP